MTVPELKDVKFEAALAELEALVHSMEDGRLELEASIAAYRRGVMLSQHCQFLLSEAEEQIRLLEEDAAVPPGHKEQP